MSHKTQTNTVSAKLLVCLIFVAVLTVLVVVGTVSVQSFVKGSLWRSSALIV